MWSNETNTPFEGRPHTSPNAINNQEALGQFPCSQSLTFLVPSSLSLSLCLCISQQTHQRALKANGSFRDIPTPGKRGGLLQL